MKPASFLCHLSCITTISSAQLPPFLTNARPSFRVPHQQLSNAQSPFMANVPNIALPGSGGGGGSSKDPPSSSILISDVVGRSVSINIFAGFTRDISGISSRLDTASQNSTILAPLNTEITKLPRKPWEDPQDYEKLGTQAYEGQDGSQRAQENLNRFVEAHVVPESPWEEGKKVKTLGGKELWWEGRSGGVKLIHPDGIEVDSVADKVANGEVWILKGVLNYAS
ncbi:MAG: hypothetical protein M1820_006406 [Bogoriella megaspora]|nr:MAG: hypothetical protein M1820_006406 [Bogoriella megaspora]